MKVRLPIRSDLDRRTHEDEEKNTLKVSKNKNEQEQRLFNVLHYTDAPTISFYEMSHGIFGVSPKAKGRSAVEKKRPLCTTYDCREDAAMETM